MRLSTPRERLLCGFVTLAVFLPLAGIFIYLMFTEAEFHSLFALVPVALFGAGAAICGKIAVTGQSWRLVDTRVASIESSAAFGLGGDMLRAVAVNVLAFPFALFSGSVPGLVGLVPLGIFGIHCLFVGCYGLWQIRSGHTRRAVLAGGIALILVIVAGMNIRVA